MKEYNKLVRDRIPEIILKNGEKPKTRILSDQEYIKELNIKLREEMEEYFESGDIEELADVFEVIKGILKYKGISILEFEKITIAKAKKRGGFQEKIYLEYVE